MDKRKRPIPYPVGTTARKRAIEFWMWDGRGYRAALREVIAANHRARNTPQRGEKCEAKTRAGTPCQCKALTNGRCKYHGGLSTGPRTAEGKMKSAANMRRC